MLTLDSEVVLEVGEDDATVLGEVVVDDATERMEAGVCGSWVAARLNGDVGRGYCEVIGVGSGGGMNGGSGSRG